MPALRASTSQIYRIQNIQPPLGVVHRNIEPAINIHSAIIFISAKDTVIEQKMKKRTESANWNKIKLAAGCDSIRMFIMTSSNGNIFRVTGHLCGGFTGLRWFPRTKASDTEFDVFFDLRLNKRLSKQSWGWWFETLNNVNQIGC